MIGKQEKFKKKHYTFEINFEMEEEKIKEFPERELRKIFDNFLNECKALLQENVPRVEQKEKILKIEERNRIEEVHSKLVKFLNTIYNKNSTEFKRELDKFVAENGLEMKEVKLTAQGPIAYFIPIKEEKRGIFIPYNYEKRWNNCEIENKEGIENTDFFQVVKVFELPIYLLNERGGISPQEFKKGKIAVRYPKIGGENG
jgi:hypothetical protein